MSTSYKNSLEHTSQVVGDMTKRAESAQPTARAMPQTIATIERARTGLKIALAALDDLEAILANQTTEKGPF